MFRITALSTIVLLAACVCAVAAGQQASNSAVVVGDWPQWAGPKGDCTSDEKGLLKEWPKEGPKVLWRIPVGVGSNHPSVAGDDLCYAESDLSDAFTETVRCVSAASGKEKWHYTYKVFPRWWVGWGELGVRATPTITDQYVYTMGTFGHGFCFERQTGKIVWQHNFFEENTYLAGMDTPKRMSNLGNLEWKGFNLPLIPVGDKIPYFMFQGGNPAIPAWQKTDISNKMQFYAYDAKTGKVAWKFEEDCKPETRGPGLCASGNGWSIKFNNEDCFAVHGNREWKLLRQSDGKQVWHWECHASNRNGGWASGGFWPAGYGKNLYFAALDGGTISVVECDFSVRDPMPKVLSTYKEALSAGPTPSVIVNGCFYGFTLDKSGKYAQDPANHVAEVSFFLQCTDVQTGKVLWKQPGFQYGFSVAAAEGMLYVHDYQKLTLVEANPRSYIEKGRVEKLHAVPNSTHLGLLDWNMPVISRGRLFVRTPLEIICYDIKDPNAK